MKLLSSLSLVGVVAFGVSCATSPTTIPDRSVAVDARLSALEMQLQEIKAAPPAAASVAPSAPAPAAAMPVAAPTPNFARVSQQAAAIVAGLNALPPPGTPASVPVVVAAPTPTAPATSAPPTVAAAPGGAPVVALATYNPDAAPVWLANRSTSIQHDKFPGVVKWITGDLGTKLDTGDNVKARRVKTDWIGQPLPLTRFIGPDGSIFDLADYQGQKQVMLVVMRGFAGQVCIACSVQTATLAHQESEFSKRDTQIVLLYPGQPESVPAFIDAVKDVDASFKVPFPILLDPSLVFVDKLNLAAALAKPTSILLDKDGVVRWAYVGESYDDRPSAKELIHQIDLLNAGTAASATAPTVGSVNP